jgi:ClpP class serine protease
MSSIYWLLSDEALQRRLVREIREARTPLSAYVPRTRPAAEGPRSLSIANGVATITVAGVLTPGPDMMAEYYGEANTTYADLQAALSAALDDKAVREIVWQIDSPGGSVDGLFPLLEDISDARATGGKAMRVVSDNAHSAAYGIAAAAGPITATRKTSSFGSVGVATSGFVQGGMCGKVVDLTNSDAPEKRPNLETPEGRDVIVRYLDQLAAEFMGSIAAGRGIKPEAVAAGYGRGSSMLASAALSAGLIDGIAKRKPGRSPYAALDVNRPVGYGPAGMAADTAPATPAPEAPAGDPPVETPETEPTTETPAGDPPAGDPPAALSAADVAELVAFRADRDARATAERRELIGALVTLRAETPGTAYANGVMVPRLASEPLADLRARVATLRAQPAAANGGQLKPPPAGATTLSDIEQATANDVLKRSGQAAHDRYVQLRLAKGNR